MCVDTLITFTYTWLRASQGSRGFEKDGPHHEQSGRTTENLACSCLPVSKLQTDMSSGLSAERLHRLHDVMAQYVKRGEIPGIVTLICRRGDVHADAIGTLTLGGHEPIRPDTIFRLASMTKPRRLVDGPLDDTDPATRTRPPELPVP
jgi:hypothetical protein